MASVLLWGGWLSVAQAQTKGTELGGSCKVDSDCLAGLLCVEVDAANALSVCLLACPQGQCLTGETCQPRADGKKVCMCDPNNPCRTGFPCINRFCPGSIFCHDTLSPCPSAAFLCFRPLSGNPWGLCLAPCTQDSDCPPPGTRCLPYNGVKACYCKADSDCRGGNVCVDFHCHRPCTKDADCNKGDHCTGKICEPRPPDAPVEPLEEVSTEPDPSQEEPSPDASFPKEPWAEASQEQTLSPDSLPDNGAELSQEPTAPTDASEPTAQEISTEQRDTEPAHESQSDASGKEPQREGVVPEAGQERHEAVIPGTCGCEGGGSLPSLWILGGLLLWLRRRRGASFLVSDPR